MPSLTLEEFATRYPQSDGSGQASGVIELGRGGASSGVERRVRADGCVFAVKRLSALHHIEFPFLLENEVNGLGHANYRKIPRVVKFEELILLPDGDTRVVLELVEGVSLNRHLSEICLPGTVYEPSMQQHEQQVLEIAAQLLETVHRLHRLGKLAHLDITSSNIMLRKEGYEAWDQLRLLDFGFSQFCNKDSEVRDLVPQGATPTYAAPELLRSLQLLHEGTGEEYCVKISGPSADWWSVGVVLYELLTGELPFKDERNSAVRKAPDSVPSDCRWQWEDYQAVLESHQTWLDACQSAFTSGGRVEHPLLDKVRQCSANPDMAASFFIQMLHPTAHYRVNALNQMWTHPTVDRMLADRGDDLSAVAAAAEARRRSKAKQGCKARWCAPLGSCFTCASPTVEADSHVPDDCPPSEVQSDSKRSWSRHLLSKLKRDHNSRNAAAAAASDGPQNVKPQLDSAQTTAAPRGLQKHLAKLRKPFPRRSRHKGDLLSSGTDHPFECDQGCVEATEPSHSVQSSGVMQQQQQQVQVRSVSMTAVEASALAPHVQDEQQQQQQQQQGLPAPIDCTDGKGFLLPQYDAAQQRGCDAAVTVDLPSSVKTASEGSVRGSERRGGWVARGKRLLQRLHR